MLLYKTGGVYAWNSEQNINPFFDVMMKAQGAGTDFLLKSFWWTPTLQEMRRRWHHRMKLMRRFWKKIKIVLSHFSQWFCSARCLRQVHAASKVGQLCGKKLSSEPINRYCLPYYITRCKASPFLPSSCLQNSLWVRYINCIFPWDHTRESEWIPLCI